MSSVAPTAGRAQPTGLIPRPLPPGVSAMLPEPGAWTASDLLARSQRAAATERLVADLHRHPTGPDAPTVAYLSAEQAFASGDDRLAVTRFAAFVAAYPTDPRRDDGLFRLGEAQLRAGDPAAAQPYFAEVLARYPTGPRAAEAAYWLGETARQNRDLPTAVRYLRQATATGSLQSFAGLSLGVAYEGLNRPDSALAAYEALVGLPTTPAELRARAVISASRVRFTTGQYAEAVAALDRELAEPTLAAEVRAEAVYLRAEALYRQNLLPAARDGFAAFVRTYPAHPWAERARYSLGWSLLALGDFLAAADTLRPIARTRSELAPAAGYQRGRSLRLAGRNADALDQLAAVSRTIPRSLFADDALYDESLVRYTESKWGSTRLALLNLINTYPESDRLAEAFQLLGETYFRLGQYDLGGAAYRRILGLKDVPDALRREAFYGQAWGFQRSNDLGDAVNNWQRFLAAYPTDSRVPDALFWLAEAQFARRQYGPAQTRYTELIRRFPQTPKLPQALYGLGYAQLRAKAYPTAARTFEQFLQRYPSGPLAADAQLRLADSYFASKQYAAAGAAYARAGRTNSGGDNGAYALYQRAQSAYKSGEVARALSLFDSLQSAFPKSGLIDDAMYATGWIAFQAQDYPTAIGRFQALIAALPDSPLAPKALYSVADAHYNSGDLAAARQTYETLIRRYPTSPFAADAISGLSFTLVALGETEDAVDQTLEGYRRADTTGALGDNLLYRQGEFLSSSSAPAKGIERFEQFLTTYPESPLVPDVLLKLGAAYRSAGRAVESARAYSRLVDEYPDAPAAPEALVALSKADGLPGASGGGEAALNRVITLYPRSEQAIQARYLRAEAMLKREQPDSAIVQYQAVVDSVATRPNLSPLGYGALLGLARAYTAIGQPDPAAVVLERITQASVSGAVGAEATVRLGKIQHLRGADSLAVATLGVVPTRFPTQADWVAQARLTQAEAHLSLNDPATARTLLEAVSKDHPSDAWGEQARTRLAGLAAGAQP